MELHVQTHQPTESVGRNGIYSRHHAAIDEDASLELDQLRMLAIVERVLANLRSAPGMDGDVEEGARLEGRSEASHRRQAKRTSAAAVGDFGVRDDMAAHLEFLQGHSGVTARGEEKHVPVVVAHDDE